jgi:endonuclease/exonuclease/phosphatase family metal-dependent hydrolase
MAKFVRKFTKRIFIVSNIIIVAFFLLGCLNPFLNPNNWWFVALMGLAFPFLLVLVAAFVIFWLIFRSKWAFLSIAALILSFPNIKALIGFNVNAEFNTKKDSAAVRVLTWNVMWFDEQTKPDKKQKPRRREMFDFIAKQNADILCFQEFLEANPSKKSNYSNIKEIMNLGYPYLYWAKDHEISWGVYNAGVAIFSKYPIVDTLRIQYEGSASERAAESLIAADINVNGKTLRVYTTHLRSNLLRKDDYRSLEIIRNAEDSMLEASKSILRKLRNGYRFRGSQAEMVREEADKSPHPEIVCGDFNDVPNSYTYFTIKGDRQDAFVQQGSGIGRTYANISLTLRIDYILASKKFRVQQVGVSPLPYSDHYPVVADLTWRE